MEKCKHSNKYPCTECEGIFDSLSTLIDHTNSHMVHIVLYYILILLFFNMNYICKYFKIELLFIFNINVVATCT